METSSSSHCRASCCAANRLFPVPLKYKIIVTQPIRYLAKSFLPILTQKQGAGNQKLMIFTIVFIVLLWYIEKNTEVCRPDSLRWYGSGRKGIAMLKDGKIVLAKTEDRELFLLPQMTNRHGLIAGATGTGKTATMKVMAESFSDLGVPVFLADV